MSKINLSSFNLRGQIFIFVEKIKFLLKTIFLLIQKLIFWINFLKILTLT